VGAIVVGTVVLVRTGGRGVDVLVVGRGTNGSGAKGSCNRKKEKAARRSSTAAMAIRSNWFGVRFLIMG
jgi:hypothetical protein